MDFLTPSREAQAQTEAKGSRFIAHLIPIADWQPFDLAAEQVLFSWPTDWLQDSHLISEQQLLDLDGLLLDLSAASLASTS